MVQAASFCCGRAVAQAQGMNTVDAIIRPAVYELGEDVCEISLRIDAVQFCPSRSTMQRHAQLTAPSSWPAKRIFSV